MDNDPALLVIRSSWRRTAVQPSAKVSSPPFARKKFAFLGWSGYRGAQGMCIKKRKEDTCRGISN